MDLERDAFILTSIPGQLDRLAVEAAIKELGFSARFMAAMPRQALSAAPEDLPEPLASAVAEARRDGKLVLLDFTAAWCPPCIVIKRDVLPDPRVQKAMQGYVLLHVDTDTETAAVRHLAVSAMPTLVILDGDGQERERLVGAIDALRLAEALERAAGSSL